ncbi:kinase-like domain-containing protein [Glomus cerebriforme]|uniref:Kinase-like domain-containing protein n=1 Tax=Glomus cerebriforme TaxID=658196 RepID=A0A397S9K2_9GLOM|nr:kinase-like domain-containing protein [Glomus cerebriforme]
MTLENHKKWLQSAIAGGHIVNIPFVTFDQVNVIARGTFSEISHAYWKSAEKTVALKSCHNNNSFGNFIKELHLIRSVDFHDNIIRFYGVSEDPVTRKYFMVLHYANEGNLQDFLKENHKYLNWKTRINMAMQIASGIKCIHERNIVHRGLYPKNILVHDGKMIITGFGLSKSLENEFELANNNDETYIIEEMTGYFEPQCFINSTYKRNKASDIYSLGILLWEISSGRPPFNNMKILDIARKIVQGKREVPIKDSPPAYIEIYQMAWDIDPRRRPTINKVRDNLEKLSLHLRRNSEYQDQQTYNDPYSYKQSQLNHPNHSYTPSQLCNFQNLHKFTCAGILIKYVEEFQYTHGYVEPDECHAGYHAGMGDIVGLRWHLYHYRRVDDNYNFSDMSDNLVLITAKFCSRKNLNIIFQCLKENGANFKVITKKAEQTAFHLLFFNLALCNKITHSKDKLDKYHEVLFQAIKFLKNMGCNINSKDRNGRTILSYYLEEKYLHQEKTPIIRALLKNGADPNVSVTLPWNFDAKTALFQAVKNKWPNNVLELILRYGVDVKAVNKDGINVLAIATLDKNLSIMTWMLENISRVNEKDCIKIAKKFAGNFTTKEYQLLNKRRSGVF